MKRLRKEQRERKVDFAEKSPCAMSAALPCSAPPSPCIPLGIYCEVGQMKCDVITAWQITAETSGGGGACALRACAPGA